MQSMQQPSRKCLAELAHVCTPSKALKAVSKGYLAHLRMELGSWTCARPISHHHHALAAVRYSVLNEKRILKMLDTPFVPARDTVEHHGTVVGLANFKVVRLLATYSGREHVYFLLEAAVSCGHSGQAGQGGQVGQVGQVRQVGQVGQAGHAGQVGQVRQVGQVGQAGHAGQVGQVRQVGQVGQAGQAGQVGPVGYRPPFPTHCTHIYIYIHT